jgi:hypothetical protein
MRSSRIVTTIVSMLTLALLSVGVASAAPTNSPNAEMVPLECDNGATYMLAVNGNGHWTPGHIIDGGSGMLIPVAFTITVLDDSGNVLFADATAKSGQRKGHAGDLVTCTFSETFEEGDETLTFAGTVSALLAPRGK